MFPKTMPQLMPKAKPVILPKPDDEDFDLELFKGEESEVEVGVEDIVWEEAIAELTLYVLDYTLDAPVEGALVTINGHSDTTDSDGKVVFDLPAATYTYTVEHDDYPTISGSVTLAMMEIAEYIITLAKIAEDTETSVSIEEIDWIDAGFDVEFTVQDDDTEVGIEGAVVTFLGEQETTNSSGVALFENIGVPLGYHPFEVEADGYTNQGWEIEVTENKQITVNMWPPAEADESGDISIGIESILWLDA